MSETLGPQQLSGYRVRGYDHLIATLARSRESQGVRQQDLGERIGVTRSSISDWERGRFTALGPNLIALAHALGYDLALIPREQA